MEKVRFSCPRCNTMMQTAAEKVGYDVACPNCAHRFKLVESDTPSANSPNAPGSSTDDVTMPPRNSPVVPQEPAAQPFSQSQPATSPNQATTNPYIAPATPVASAPQYHQSYSCPYCQTKIAPEWKSEVSTVGWIVFGVLLISTCFGCFIGLFIRDKYRICSQCKIRLG